MSCKRGTLVEGFDSGLEDLDEVPLLIYDSKVLLF